MKRLLIVLAVLLGSLAVSSSADAFWRCGRGCYRGGYCAPMYYGGCYGGYCGPSYAYYGGPTYVRYRAPRRAYYAPAYVGYPGYVVYGW